MFGRRTRTQLPSAEELLRPQIAAVETIKKQTLRQKEKQFFFYNQHVKELSPLKNGQVARVAPQPTDKQNKWSKGKVEDQVDIRSYRVRTEDGRVFRRNRRHLKCSKESFYPSDNTTELQVNHESQETPEEVTTKRRNSQLNLKHHNPLHKNQSPY